jgi:hypothetical protein
MNTDDNRYVENAAGDKAKNYASKVVVLRKDLVALLRDLALLVLALLLLFFSTTFNSVLSTAGFEEGSFVVLSGSQNSLVLMQLLRKPRY